MFISVLSVLKKGNMSDPLKVAELPKHTLSKLPKMHFEALLKHTLY